VRVYVFQNGDSDLYAYSWDKTGSNIPPRDPRYVWLLRGEVGDLKNILPAAEASHVLRDLIELGFHLFKSDRMP
jgi:hypothetical protein